MAEARYNRLDNQSPTQTQLENTEINVGKSAYDFSKVTTGNALIGAVIPIDCFDVVPTEDIAISLNAYLEFRNPTTRQLLNGFRVYFHGYFNDLSDLWEGADNWLDTGLRSDVSISRPSLVYSVADTRTSSIQGDILEFWANSCTPMSLLNYLGLPAEFLAKSVSKYGIFTGTGVQTGASVSVPPLRSFMPAYTSKGREEGSVTVGTYTTLNHVNGYFPADCAFAYQKNWRDYYANRNLLMKNKYWFPNNEKHFILSYECTEAVVVNYGNEKKPSVIDDSSSFLLHEAQALSITGSYLDYRGVGVVGAAGSSSYFNGSTLITGDPSNPSTVPFEASSAALSDYQKSVNEWLLSPNLSGLKFRQFRGDRFTTALPFKDLIRGDVPVLSINASSAEFVPLRAKDINSGDVDTDHIVYNVSLGAGDSKNILGLDTSLSSTHTKQFGSVLSDMTLSDITMNAIRELETMTVFKERQARISNRDSYYNGFIESQFGASAKQHDSRGIYLGGFYQDVVVSPVTQTSESANTPLGTKAGIGISNGSGTITNNFHVNNFGWIQIYMSIVPDVFYTQGKPRMFDKKNQLDMYFPLFNNLEPQAIKNKELYVSGTESVDDDIYAYEDRYAEYKSRPNTVTGFMALSHSVAEYDASRIMARRFSATPELNNAFVMMIPENIDMSVFSVADEPPFDYQIGIQCRRVFPGPYTAIPGSMSSNLHA